MLQREVGARWCFERESPKQRFSRPTTEDEILAQLALAWCYTDDAGSDPDYYPDTAGYLRGIPERLAWWSEGSFAKKIKAD